MARKTQLPRCRQTSTPSEWLSSRYANRAASTGCFYAYFLQVLTGETPFHDVRQAAPVLSAVWGTRPAKPENAPAIGFSDSLWGFTQRCWDGKVELRPEVGEVVTQLEEAVASWDGLMPPCVQAENATSASKGEMSDSMKYSEFEILISLWYWPLSNHTDGLFQQPPDVVPERSIESQTTFGPFSRPSTPSTQYTESPLNNSRVTLTATQRTETSRKEPRGVFAKLLRRLLLESRALMQPRSEEPHDPHGAKASSHINGPHRDSPPPQLSQMKQKGSKRRTPKLRILLGLEH